MWYPDIRLTRTFRLAFMSTLIASFFVISPILILYTAGYRFDFETLQVKKTGVITIDVEPTDAHITLNNTLLQKSVPIRLANRAPGTYALHIERAGYLPWSKTVQVESTHTTYVTDLFLFLDVLPTFEVDLSQTIEASYSPDGRYVAIVDISDTDTLLYEVALYDIRSETTSIIWRGNASENPVLTWSRHAPLLAIAVHDKAQTATIETIDARTPDTTDTYTLEAFTHTPYVQWHEDGEAILYVQESTDIISLSNESKKVLRSVTSSVWFVDSANDVWSIADTSIWKNDALIHRLSDTIDITAILDTRASHIFAQDKENSYIIWLDSGNITQVAAINAFPRTYGKSWSTWILWSEWEVIELLESGDTILLTRTNKPLNGVSASAKHNTLFFSFDESITSFHPGYRTTNVLFEGNTPISSVATDQDGEYILFETSINGRRGVYRRAL